MQLPQLHTVQVLTANIDEESANLEPDILRSTIKNAVKRAQISGTGHLTDIILSTSCHPNVPSLTNPYTHSRKIS